MLHGVNGVTLRDKVCNREIRKGLDVEWLLRITRSQLRWFGHVTRMLDVKIGQASTSGYNHGKATQVRPRTRWRDNSSDFAWSCFCMEPAKFSEIAVDHELFRVLLGLLLLWNWLRAWTVFIIINLFLRCCESQIIFVALIISIL